MSPSCHGVAMAGVFRLMMLMLFAAGSRSPGHCSHDGETGRHDGRNRPRCASGMYPQTDTKAGMLLYYLQSNTKFAAVLHKDKTTLRLRQIAFGQV